MKKPASRPIAKALPTDRGYRAQFALPGMIPDFFRDREGRVAVFRTVEDAENAARLALFNKLESRTVDTRKAGPYNRLPPAQLGVLLSESDVTPTEFARIYGVPQSRVIKWLEGEQDIPHSANLIAHALKDEAFRAAARAFTWEWEDPQLQKGIEDGAEEEG